MVGGRRTGCARRILGLAFCEDVAGHLNGEADQLSDPPPVVRLGGSVEGRGLGGAVVDSHSYERQKCERIWRGEM